MENIDVEKIEKLVSILKEALKDGELTSISLEQDTFSLHLGKDHPAPAYAAPLMGPIHQATPQQPSLSNPLASLSGGVEAIDEPGIVYVKSPMVGTFYRAPSPDSDPYAEVGTKVKPETVVCIIEAMKVMNEIQSEVSGTVEEVLLENGAPVEYGQPLFKVRQG
ncbi:MAG: acetyl-CoA carboxylase biotin carboxyl carrier protein [Puniceicoccaceae bacterium]